MVGPSAIGSVKGAPTSITSRASQHLAMISRESRVRDRTSAALLEGKQNIRRALRLGVSRRNIRHKRSLLVVIVSSKVRWLSPAQLAPRQLQSCAESGNPVWWGRGQNEPSSGPCTAGTSAESLPSCNPEKSRGIEKNERIGGQRAVGETKGRRRVFKVVGSMTLYSDSTCRAGNINSVVERVGEGYNRYPQFPARDQCTPRLARLSRHTFKIWSPSASPPKADHNKLPRRASPQLRLSDS